MYKTITKVVKANTESSEQPKLDKEVNDLYDLFTSDKVCLVNVTVNPVIYNNCEVTEITHYIIIGVYYEQEEEE